MANVALDFDGSATGSEKPTPRWTCRPTHRPVHLLRIRPDWSVRVVRSQSAWSWTSPTTTPWSCNVRPAETGGPQVRQGRSRTSLGSQSGSDRV